ncbi:MAG: hypothetical protein HKO07_07425, partial [Pseudomonadales bacterium]|nr:hypothetical protein [Pseudomonadales bacterium]
MANPRNATPRKSAAKPASAFATALPAIAPQVKQSALNLLGKLTRIHLVVLSVAMCSIVLAVSAPFGESNKAERFVIDLPLDNEASLNTEPGPALEST